MNFKDFLYAKSTPEIFVKKIISAPQHKYPAGNNTEIRFVFNNSFTWDGFYSVHFTNEFDVKFSLKHVKDGKSTLICRGIITLDSFFSSSLMGNEEISDTPLNLLNMMFHKFNYTMDGKKDSRWYRLKSMGEMDMFDF